MNPSPNTAISKGPPLATPPSLRDRPSDEFVGMFDVAATIQKLCSEGTLDLGVIPTREREPEPSAAPPVPKPSIEAEGPESPDWNILDETFLQTVVDCLAKKSELSVGLIVASRAGGIIQSVHSGWDASDFRVHTKLLAKVAKESVWRMQPHFSLDAVEVTDCDLAAATAEDSSNPKLARPQVDVSHLLNELGLALGTPLFANPVVLKESSSVALWVFEATPCVGSEPDDYLASANSCWLNKSHMEGLIQHLDAWLIVRRCGGFARVVKAIEWIRTQPRWWLPPLLIACSAMLVPVPYYPKRECVFEPETKQYLSSPIAGRIASCEVQPGDHVEQGQLLARIDDDQLRRDLATAQAEYDGALKKRDSALATRATGNVGLADVEMKQAQWRVESIQDQLQRLEIRAKSSGIVVQGDWKRNVGMPLTLGQSLFEVAELESMTAEVRLLSTDLAQISVGDEVSVRSDASGMSTFRGKISRIEPHATVIEEVAVFIADVVIHDPELKLRPGMKAKAQIDAGWCSIGWLLFDRPARWIANQWIW